ncbi:MAG: hypothetical protein K9M99_13300 [Candidatus Cloacimonetes bacterium]|nr:hypothetical protein [Candidatus Cloacimonadota bacterium]
MDKRKIDSLVKIGLREIEAEIYLVLLREPDITAYKVAKIISKPKTTIYKALDIMQNEGLIQGNQAAQPLTYSAIPITEYLDEKEKKFSATREEVEEELKDIKQIKANTGIFPITQLSQAFSKAQEVISGSEEVILIACTTLTEPEIIDAIQQTANRGVKVFIQSFKTIPGLMGVEYVSSHFDEEISQNISYNWLEIFSDGKEYFLSLLSPDFKQLYKAQWCNDPYTSILTYNANVGSFILTKTNEMIRKKLSYQEIEQSVKENLKKYYKRIKMQTIEHLIDN